MEYVGCRNKVDKIYEQKINDIRIRSECDWYEYREKSSKFFLNLEKSRAAQNTIRNITKDEKILDVIKELIKSFLTFIKTYFQKTLTCPRMKLCNF